MHRLQTKFTTGEDNHIGDDYFLTSGDKIRYFLDEDAIDENGNLTRDKDKSVNKIGHGMCLVPKFVQLSVFPTALHQLDPVFRRVTLENDRLKALVRDLQFHNDPVGKDV